MAPAVPLLAEPAISLQSDPAISHARRVFPYAAGAATSNARRRWIWIIWRWWWIEWRCLQAVQLLLVQLSGDVAD